MLIPWRDRVATLLVAAATLVYVLWYAGPFDGLTAGGVALIVLALGFIASASAVVPGFAALIHGSILMAATIGLWAAATARHAIGRERRAVAVG